VKTVLNAGFALLMLLSLNSVSADTIEDGIRERTAPAAKLCIAGEPCAAAVAPAGPKEPRSGEQVYTASCSACHAVGVSGAPKFESAADWAPRAAQGMDTVYKHALEGLNAMPAMGLCMDCSEDEVKAAVDYMIESTK